jgi:IS605 OrfB family transposase
MLAFWRSANLSVPLVTLHVVKLVVQVKLVPSPEQAMALAATIQACNQAATYVSRVAFNERIFGRNDLHKRVYMELRASFGLSAQPAVRTIKKVVDAYATLHANLRNGNLGKPGSIRRIKATSKPVAFRPRAAQPFDDRCLSWRHDANVVSIWTVHGRIKDIAFTGEPGQLTMLAKCRKGESNLVHRGGRWFLFAICEVAAEPVRADPVDWIGVDRGIVNLATTSDGKNYSGRRLARYRRWQVRKRAELQAKRTKSATRLAKRRSRREARHATQVNHKMAKQIVADAKRTGRGIAVENLVGIRDRVRLHRHQRAALSSWPFGQLGQHLTYKAQLAGVPLLEVDAAYTSQTCPRCGHVGRRNRPTRDVFSCVVCGLAGSADFVAAVNVRQRARRVWVLVNVPVPQGSSPR